MNQQQQPGSTALVNMTSSPNTVGMTDNSDTMAPGASQIMSQQQQSPRAMKVQQGDQQQQGIEEQSVLKRQANVVIMEHRASAEGKIIHGRRILHLSLRDGEFVFLSQVKKRLLYHVDKKEVLNAQRCLQLAANIRRLTDEEINAINKHIEESGSEAVVNSSCQLLGVQDAEKFYHYVVDHHGQPPHLTQESRSEKVSQNSFSDGLQKSTNDKNKKVSANEPCVSATSKSEIENSDTLADKLQSISTGTGHVSIDTGNERKVNDKSAEEKVVKLGETESVQSSDLNNNRAEENEYQAESTWLSEYNVVSPSGGIGCTKKRKLETEQEPQHNLPEKSPKFDQTKDVSAFDFCPDDPDSKNLYPNGTPARIVKRRHAVFSSQGTHTDQSDMLHLITPKSKALDVSTIKTKSAQNELKLSHKKTKLRVFGSKLARPNQGAFRHRPSASKVLPSVTIKTTFEDVKQVEIPSTGVLYEIGKLLVNGAGIRFVTIDSVRYVTKRAIYRQLLPPSTGLYGENNFQSLCKMCDIAVKVVAKKDLPSEIFETQSPCTNRISITLVREDDLLKLYTRYLVYEEKKKKKFCPRVAWPFAAETANTTTDVISLLQKQGYNREQSVDAGKIEPNEDDPKPNGKSECSEKPNLEDNTLCKGNSTSNDTRNVAVELTEEFSHSNLSLSLPANPSLISSSMYGQRSISNACGTLENTSSVSLNTLPSSDYTASAFIKSNYEVLAQDPYAGPLVSVDMMNSTVEELGIRKAVNSSQWNNSKCHDQGMGEPGCEGSRLIEEKNVFINPPAAVNKQTGQEHSCTKPQTTSCRPDHKGTKDFSSQTSPSQPLSEYVDDSLTKYREEISCLRKELEQARQGGKHSCGQCGTADAVLGEFCSSQILLQQQIKKFVGLNGKIATTLVSLVRELQQEKEATKEFTKKIQALNQQ